MVPGTGPPRPRDGPDAMTIADSSHVRGGILAAGTRSSSTLAMRGTSVSAPQLARFVAREFAGGKPGNRDAVMQEAQLREDALTASGSIWPQGPIKPSPWAFRGGSGRIDLTPDLPPANRRR